MSSELTRALTNRPERLGIVPELYAASSEYTTTLKRLQEKGTREDEISFSFYYAAVRTYADSLASWPGDGLPPNPGLYDACIGLAAIALRLARKVRLSS